MTALLRAAPAGLRWPLTALAAWAACWAIAIAMRGVVGHGPALAIGAGLGVALGWFGSTPWRRAFIAAGFPVSLLASGLVGPLPAWAWLVALVALAALYPMNAWRDAPYFPTPAGALAGLARHARLPDGAQIVEAGCGLGEGLAALHREYPAARLTGIEWSRPLAWICTLRCPYASVRRGDFWRADWSGAAMVYLFQRPESMPRAIDKAAAELRPGAWLASLEFEAPGLKPQAVLRAGARPVWLYRAPFVRR